jgi:hypothetical protein
VVAAGTTGDRIAALYRAALGRGATLAEIRAATGFLTPTDPGADSHSKLSRWEQLAQVLLMTNEFLFVD